MAIVDKYRNKLTSTNKNNALQNSLRSGLQKNTTSLQSGLQDNVTTTNELGETNKSYLNGESSSNYAWPDIQSMINAKTANPKAELQMAMQKAQSMSNDYLKALGLQGSGVGQSQLSDIGVQYQNALSKINQTARDEVISQVDKDFEGAVSSGRYSARDAQNYINRYGEQTGLGESWKNVAQDYGATYEQEASNVFQNLKDIIEGDTYELADKSTVDINSTQKKYAEKLRDELRLAYNNGDQEEFYKTLDENVDFLNTLNHTEVSSLKKNKDGSYVPPEKYMNLPMSLDTYFDATKISNRDTLKNTWYKKNNVYFIETNNGITALKNGKVYNPKNKFELKELVGE